MSDKIDFQLWKDEIGTDDFRRLVEDRESLLKAASALLGDVRSRYPGEPLRCKFMQELDAAVVTASI